MTWADEHIRMLQNGDIIQFRPRGNSMSGKIEANQLVTLRPCRGRGDVAVGNAVLCKVDGKVWLHLVSAIGADGRFQISNASGHVNGWTTLDKIFGVVTKVEN